tara:strand:+ start:3927 stop:4505 length:579 start_codon:yes stop_codon:yes gene_type:complete
LTRAEKNIKRLFDIFFSIIGLLLLGWILLIIVLLSKIFIGGKGIFTQDRVGQFGEIFAIYKIQTIGNRDDEEGNVKLSRLGEFLRKSKIDELPQLLNVLYGNMSFVGPRPDIKGYADELIGEEKIILEVKPGITGPASIYFKSEEKLLESKNNPEKYNREVIWPKKVRINIKYVKEYSFCRDIYYLFKTLFN